jgi:hypothetical protein
MFYRTGKKVQKKFNFAKYLPNRIGPTTPTLEALLHSMLRFCTWSYFNISVLAEEKNKKSPYHPRTNENPSATEKEILNNKIQPTLLLSMPKFQEV